MQYTMMLKPASGHCNLRCKYCFYIDECNARGEYSMGMMTAEDAEKFVNCVLAQLNDDDAITFAFQGGEPTLAGLPFFERFIQAVQQHPFSGKANYTLQTNGYVIDNTWAAFLHQHDFLLGLSLDGPAQYHDANRINVAGEGTYAQIMKVKSILDAHQVEYNILTVLTERAARHPQEYWNFISKNKIQYIQFVPCLCELSGGNSAGSALSPQRFASFYSAIFPLWANALKNGQYVSIKFFDDFFNLMLRRSCTACGFTGMCSIQLVIEADGSVYPCDFYVLDEWKLGNIYETPIKALQSCEVSSTFISRPRTHSALCEECKYRKLCGGGCPRMKTSMYLDESASFCGYQTFLNNCKVQIEQVAQYLTHRM